MIYPDPDLLIYLGSLKYYGHISWRPGKGSIEPPGMGMEQKVPVPYLGVLWKPFQVSRVFAYNDPGNPDWLLDQNQGLVSDFWHGTPCIKIYFVLFLFTETLWPTLILTRLSVRVPWNIMARDPGDLARFPSNLPTWNWNKKESMLCYDEHWALILFCSNSISGSSVETFPGLQGLCL